MVVEWGGLINFLTVGGPFNIFIKASDQGSYALSFRSMVRERFSREKKKGTYVAVSNWMDFSFRLLSLSAKLVPVENHTDTPIIFMKLDTQKGGKVIGCRLNGPWEVLSVKYKTQSLSF